MTKAKLIYRIKMILFTIFKPLLSVIFFCHYSYKIIVHPFLQEVWERLGNGILKPLVKSLLEPRLLFLLLVPFGNFIYYAITAIGPTRYSLGYHVFSWVYWFGGVIVYGFIGQYT